MGLERRRGPGRRGRKGPAVSSTEPGVTREIVTDEYNGVIQYWVYTGPDGAKWAEYDPFERLED